MKLLFIGNSHTFAHALPFQLRTLLPSVKDFENTDVTMLAVGGQTLGWHAKQRMTRMAILYDDWDYIVLQQKSHPFDGEKLLEKDCKKLLKYIRKTGASVLLFSTWPEEKNPENQTLLDEAFKKVSSKHGMILVPVSVAWQLVRERHDINLYDKDGEHANELGAYVSACVFYAIITGKSPVGLPGKLEIKGDCLVDVPEKDLTSLQECAWDAYKNSTATVGQSGRR